MQRFKNLGQQPLEVMGQFTSNIIYNGQSEQVVIVIKGLKKKVLIMRNVYVANKQMFFFQCIQSPDP